MSSFFVGLVKVEGIALGAVAAAAEELLLGAALVQAAAAVAASESCTVRTLSSRLMAMACSTLSSSRYSVACCSEVLCAMASRQRSLRKPMSISGWRGWRASLGWRGWWDSSPPGSRGRCENFSSCFGLSEKKMEMDN